LTDSIISQELMVSIIMDLPLSVYTRIRKETLQHFDLSRRLDDSNSRGGVCPMLYSLIHFLSNEYCNVSFLIRVYLIKRTVFVLNEERFHVRRYYGFDSIYGDGRTNSDCLDRLLL